MESTERPIWIASVVAGLVSIPATYSLLRGYDVLFRTEANAAKVVWSPHIAMFWRICIGGYLAGMLATLVFLAARHDLHRTMQVLSASVLVVGALALVQGLFLP